MEGMLHDYKCLETFLKIPQGVKKVNPLYYFFKNNIGPGIVRFNEIFVFISYIIFYSN